MLKKNEIKVLEILCEDFTRDLTITDIAKKLKQKYVQTHKTIYSLEHTKIITIKSIGKSKIIKIKLDKDVPEYILAERERTNNLCKRNISLAIIKKDIQEVTKNFICILFGSQTRKPKPQSDIDLLFIIPKEYNLEEFEREVKKKLIARNTDIVILTENSLHIMWSNPQKLNVGNEILKNHIILYGAEHFFNILRKHNVG